MYDNLQTGQNDELSSKYENTKHPFYYTGLKQTFNVIARCYVQKLFASITINYQRVLAFQLHS